MTKISGIVTEVKTRNTRVGDMYDVVVNGTSYGHGKYAPRGIKAGDFVTFEYETKVNGQYTNHNIVPRSLRKEDSPAPEAVAQAKAETRTVLAAGDKRQETISKQANLNTAIAAVTLQLQHGGLKFPASAKAPDVFSAIDKLILDTAGKYYKLTTGDEWPELNTAPSVKKPAARDQDDAPFEDDQFDSDTVL